MCKFLFLACTILFSFKGRAFELHLKLEEEAQKVLAEKPGAIGLEEIKKMVVNDSLDLQISYERVIEAQKKIGLARAAYFPYDLGNVAAMYFLNVWHPLLLAELITGIPSRAYNVQAEKYMSIAQKFSLQALSENIKNQVAQLYYSVLKEETALKFAALRIALMEEMIRAYKERVAIGPSTETEALVLEQSLRSLRDTYLQFRAYMAETKTALNIMLGLSPSEGAKVNLQAVPKLLNAQDFQIDVNEMAQMALKRSHEIIAADYMVMAARKAKKSTQWSILTFGGIGFDYYFRVHIAASKVDQAKLIRQYVEENLINQAYLMNGSFKRSLKLVQSEKEIFDDSAFYMNSHLEKFKSGAISIDKLLETQLIYLKDFNELAQSHYLSLSRLDDLERVAMGSVKGISSYEHDAPVAVSFKKRKRKWHDLSISIPEGLRVLKVEYEFDDSMGLRPMKSYTSNNDFTISLKLNAPEFLAGAVKITLENGEMITKRFHVNAHTLEARVSSIRTD